MAAAVATTANSGWATAASSVVPKPSGLALGDLMISQAYLRDNAPVGWTSLGFSTFDSGLATFLAYKYADSSDVAATDFTFTNSGGSVVGIVAILRLTEVTNLGSLFVYGGNSITATNTATPTVSAGVTPNSRGNSILLQFWAGSTNVADISGYAIVTSNPTWTELYDITDGVGKCMACAWALRPQTTATGNVSAAGGDATSDWVMGFLSVAPGWVVSQTDTNTISEPTIKEDISLVQVDTITVSDTVDTDDSILWTNQTKHTSVWTEQNKS